MSLYCTNCGVLLSESATFCSGCGKSPLASPSVARPRDWEFHVNVLGWLVIAHGALTGLIGMIVMFGGQFAARFLMANPGFLDGDVPPEVLGLIGPVTFLLGAFLVLISMPSIGAGVGLLRYRSWGRVLTLVLSFLRIFDFPLGTVTAIYSFWVLLSQGGRSFYELRAAQSEGSLP